MYVCMYVKCVVYLYHVPYVYHMYVCVHIHVNVLHTWCTCTPFCMSCGTCIYVPCTFVWYNCICIPGTKLHVAIAHYDRSGTTENLFAKRRHVCTHVLHTWYMYHFVCGMHTCCVVHLCICIPGTKLHVTMHTMIGQVPQKTYLQSVVTRLLCILFYTVNRHETSSKKCLHRTLHSSLVVFDVSVLCIQHDMHTIIFTFL